MHFIFQYILKNAKQKGVFDLIYRNILKFFHDSSFKILGTILIFTLRL